MFFYAACEGEVFRETGLYDKPYSVNFNTDAVIKNFEILRDFLINWRIWYRSGSASSWEMILLALEALTSSNHPSSEFNIRQFERADVIGALLLGCQVGWINRVFGLSHRRKVYWNPCVRIYCVLGKICLVNITLYSAGNPSRRSSIFVYDHKSPSQNYPKSSRMFSKSSSSQTYLWVPRRCSSNIRNLSDSCSRQSLSCSHCQASRLVVNIGTYNDLTRIHYRKILYYLYVLKCKVQCRFCRQRASAENVERFCITNLKIALCVYLVFVSVWAGVPSPFSLKATSHGRFLCAIFSSWRIQLRLARYQYLLSSTVPKL